MSTITGCIRQSDGKLTFTDTACEVTLPACLGASGQLLVYHADCDGVGESDGWFEVCLTTEGLLQITVPECCVVDEWAPFAEGMNSTVYALLNQAGTLVAGGSFTTADGNSANRIAYWTGSTWAPFAGGMNNTVYALVDWGGTLVAAGAFTTADGNSANRIAYWTGSTWAPFAGGMNNPIYALVDWGGTLVAGGTFITADGNSANRIAYWTGSTWAPFAGGMPYPGSVYALINWSDGTLIAGGKFITADGNSANRIAYWTGSTWAPFAGGMTGQMDDPTVHALVNWEGTLGAGGTFDSADGNSAKYIAQWTGSTWLPFAEGMGWTVYALANWGGTLVAGGKFTTAGGDDAYRIAYWTGSP